MCAKRAEMQSDYRATFRSRSHIRSDAPIGGGATNSRGGVPTSHPRMPRADLVFAVTADVLLVRQREARRLDRYLGIFDLSEAIDQALPLVRLEQGRELRVERAAFERVIADVNVVVVVGHREAGVAG